MSYVHKKTRIFHNSEEKEQHLVRSECRMKSYSSTVDSRAWSDVVEDRKQHILECLGRDKTKLNSGKLIPIDCLVEAMIATKNERLRHLSKKAAYMENMIELYSEIELTPDQEEKLIVMKKNLEMTYGELASLDVKLRDKKEATEKQMLKLFESEWTEPNTEGSIDFSTSECSSVSLDFGSSPRSEITGNEKLLENIKQQSIMGGIVTLSRPLTSRMVSGGYFAHMKTLISSEVTKFDEQTEIDDFTMDIREDKIQSEFESIEKVPEANEVPQLTFAEFSDSDISLDDLECKKGHMTIPTSQYDDDIEDATLSPATLSPFTLSPFTLSPLQSQFDNIKLQLVQTEDVFNIPQYKIPSLQRSRSCPYINQDYTNKIKTLSTDQIRIESTKKHLKFRSLYAEENRQQQTERKLLEEKCCGTENKLDVYEICKTSCSLLFKKRAQREEAKASAYGEYQLEQALLEEPREDLSDLIIHKNAEIIALKDALKAKESYCAEQKKHAEAALEQLDNIKNIAEERDDLHRKLENSKEELEHLKRLVELRRSWKLHSEDSAGETERADSQSTCSLATPKTAAKIATREMQALKKISLKLSAAQEENYHLKNKLSKYEELFDKLGVQDFNDAYVEQLKHKLECLEETTRERDSLKHRVEELETEFTSYNYLPEDIEVFKQRSLLLDDVLNDRDRLSKRVEQLRGIDDEVVNLRKKAVRVEQLEDDLRKIIKEKKFAEDEIDHLRGKCTLAEIEVLNQKADGDTLRSKLLCMEHEIENLKSVSVERERLKEERDHLKTSIDELARMQSDFDHMKQQMKCMEILKAERDMFKFKYENLLGLECECDILRTQVNKAKVIEKERDVLQNQVEDLEISISDLEAEIRSLVCHIDILAKGRDEQQEKLKEVIANLRAEVENKHSLIVNSEEKLAFLQRELSNSIHGVSSETVDLKMKNEKLENTIQIIEKQIFDLNKNVDRLLKENQHLVTRVNDLVDDNNFLLKKLEEKENSLDTLKDVLQDHEVILEEFQKSQCQVKENLRDIETETDAFDIITLEAAREQNKTMQEKLSKISTIAGDRFLHNLLVQSKDAVQKIAHELERQYKDWDSLKTKLKSHEKTKSSSQHIYTIGYCYTTEAGVGGGSETPQKRRCQCAEKNMTCSKCSGKDATEEVALSTADLEKPAESSGNEIPSTTATQTDPRDKPTEQTEQSAQTEPEKKVEIILPSDDDICTCADSEESGTQLNQGYEYDIMRWSCFQDESKMPPKDEGDEHKGILKDTSKDVVSGAQKDVSKAGPKEDDVEAFESARSIDCTKCKNLGERVQVLEVELINANDVVLSLQDKFDRVSTENDSLRRHSIEVQEVAKGQIKDLVEHLQDTKERCSCLEKDSDKVMHFLSEKTQLLEMVKDLENQKSSLEKLLAGNIVTSSRRSSAIEGDLEALKKENKELKEDEVCKTIKLDKLTEELTKHQQENKQLRKDLNKIRSEFTDPKVVKSLQSENQKLTEKIDEQFEDISNLLEKIRTPPLAAEVLEYPKDHEKGALRSISEDLEKQINDFIRMEEIEPPSDTLQNTVDTMSRRLEDAEKRAELAETALSKLNASDPGAKLKAEITKLNHRLSEVEEDNLHLNETKAEFDLFKKDMDAVHKKARMLTEDNIKLQKEINELKAELRKTFDEPTIDMLKSQLFRHEKEAEIKANELKITSEKMSKLLQNIASLKQELIKTQNENIKIKKQLHSAQKSEYQDKIKQLEKEKYRKNLKEKQELENELSKLKKVLDETLNSATASSSRVSELQEELATLKISNEEMEIKNRKLSEEFEKTKDVQGKLNQAIKENEILKRENAQAGDQLAKVKLDLEDAILSAQKSFAQRDNKLQLVKEQLATYQTENNRLKQELNDVNNDSEKYKSELKESLKKLVLLESEKGTLKRSLDAIKTAGGDGQFKKLITELEVENSKLSREINKTLEDLNKSNDVVAEYAEEISKLKLNASVIQEDNVTLKKDLNSALDEAKRTNFELLNLRDQESALKQRLAQLESENFKLKNELDSMDVANKSTTSVMQQLKDEIHREKSDLSNLHQENIKLKKDIEVSIKENASRDEIEIWRQKTLQLEKINRKIKEDLDKVTKEHKGCSKIVSQMEEENTELSQKINSLEEENEKIKLQYEGAMGDSQKKTLDELRTNEEKRKELEKDNNQLKSEICLVARNLTERRVEIESLKQKSGMLEKENEKFKKELSELSNTQHLVNQFKVESTSLKQRIAQLETENTKLKEGCDSRLGSAEGRKELSPRDSFKLKEKLNLLDEECKNLKSDLNAALNEAKRCAELQNQDLELKQQVAQMENENFKLKRELQKALEQAESGSSGVEQLREENLRMKDKIKQFENEIELLKSELNDALENTKMGVSGIGKMQENDVKQKQRISQLEKDLEKLKKELVAALQDAKSDNSVASQLRNDNALQKGKISELEKEISTLKHAVTKLPKDCKNENLELIGKLEKESVDLRKSLDDSEKLRLQLSNENAGLKSKLQQLQNDINQVNKVLNGVTNERNKILTDLTKMKEDEVQVRKRISELESVNFKLKQVIDSSDGDSKDVHMLLNENTALHKIIKEMENESKSLSSNLKAMFEDVKSKAHEIGNLKEDAAKLKQRTAELERENAKLKKDTDLLSSQLSQQKKDFMKKIEHLKPHFDKEVKTLVQRYEEDILSLKKSHEESIQEVIKKQENALVKLQQELDTANKDCDKLKNLLGDQRRKSKDIKGKVDQVEDLINNERKKCKEEQMKTKELEQINSELGREIVLLKQQLLCRTKELEDEVEKRLKGKEESKSSGQFVISTPISEKEMKYFGKPACTVKLNFETTAKKLAEEGLENLTVDELQLLNNNLSEKTADCLAQMGQTYGVLKPEENSKLSLLKKIALLEGDLQKKQKHAQQKVVAMQVAVKLEKERQLDYKKKLEEERLKNKHLLNEMGLQSNPVSDSSTEKDLQKSHSDQNIILPPSEKIVSSRPGTRPKQSKKRGSSQVHEEKMKPLKPVISSEMMLKRKIQEESSTKRSHRTHSPNSTPVKDTNGPSSSAKLSFYTSFDPDNKTAKTLYTKGMSSSPCHD